jgi:sugar transferase (PEP-CTERM/EpsH1 system associated)
MSDILLLTHRIPFPPDKGDKIRSFHMLKHLAQRHRVHLGTFIDDPRDRRYVDELRQLCESVCAITINPRVARLKSLAGLLRGEPLTLAFYRSRRMRGWARRVVAEKNIAAAIAYSSGTAQFVPVSAEYPFLRIMDFVDVDSAKWREYADEAGWPMKWVHAREAGTLARAEAGIAADFDASLFASPAEAAFFARHAPRDAGNVHGLSNGVDFNHFDPDTVHENPYSGGACNLVFTGMMDYRPNVEGILWFIDEVWPRIQRSTPGARFYIVGARPTRAVRALAREAGVTVTGRVPDVRPWIRNAHVAVAPLTIARGIQNKVLEALALGTPVVGTPQAFEGIDDFEDRARLTASTAAEFAKAVVAIAGERCSLEPDSRLREFTQSHYDWDRNLALLDQLISRSNKARARAAAAESSAPGVPA